MPWTAPLASSDELRRCIRDLVALSTLPAAWRNYDMRQIGDSIAAALISMLDADFVFIALPTHGNQVNDLIRSAPRLDPARVDQVRTMLQREKTTLNGEHEFVAADASSGKDLHVMTVPIGLSGDAILAAGCARGTFPTKTEKLLFNTAANQAAIAFHQWLDDAETLQHQLWPLVLRNGRWKGELDLVHFGSGAPISFLVDCFRIDDPLTGEPMNVAAVSRDLRAQKNSEAELRHLNDSLERRVAELTIELADANRRLVLENFEREQADFRVQKLRDELFHAGRLTAAGQMASALAHELNQPLTAVVNSANAARRLLEREDHASLMIARDVTVEAAGQAVRASEIIRRLSQFVTRNETERRREELASMIEEAGALVLSGSAPLEARLSYRFSDRATEVLVNRVQIQQVLVNLIRNAFEAMADQDQREVTLATRVLDNDMIEISVADIGPGINADIAGRLFEPFVSSKHDGMGLGLSISRSIIEAHDGQLIAERRPEGGTIFCFTLPRGGVADDD